MDKYTRLLRLDFFAGKSVLVDRQDEGWGLMIDDKKISIDSDGNVIDYDSDAVDDKLSQMVDGYFGSQQCKMAHDGKSSYDRTETNRAAEFDPRPLAYLRSRDDWVELPVDFQFGGRVDLLGFDSKGNPYYMPR